MTSSGPDLHSHHRARSCDDCASNAPLGFDLSFAYQPIVDVSTRSVFANEALVRGPAGESAASVLAQVNDGNRYRFDQACRIRAIKTAASLGLDTRISINFLPNAIYRPEVCIRTTLAAAQAVGFPLDCIIFEATEGDRVEDGARLTEIFSEYRRMGFLTAIDDFGAGYAGLTLLAEFQPDIIKLDMALVRGVDQSAPRQAIARGVLRICEDLGIRVVAEGVETAGERDFFHHAGVTLMQGYLFSRPTHQALAAIPDQSWPSR